MQNYHCIRLRTSVQSYTILQSVKTACVLHTKMRSNCSFVLLTSASENQQTKKANKQKKTTNQKMTGEVVGSRFLETFKTCLDAFLCKLI